jgi:hypothetical protein
MSPGELPSIRLKTRMITFDDRLQQVRVIHKAGPNDKGYNGRIEFLNYKYDDKAFYYLKKYRKNWMDVIRL